MRDIRNTSQTIRAPRIPIVITGSGIIIQIWVMNNLRRLVERKVLIGAGVDGWHRARDILTDPAIVHWEAMI